MTDINQPPFRRDEFLDKPGIVGARWWHEGLAHTDPVGRRKTLKTLLVVGGFLAVLPLIDLAECGVSSCGSSSPDWTTDTKVALDMQKEYGWNFGAATEALTFNGDTKQPFNKDQLAHLASDLSPSESRLRPYFIPTLFQSPTALPRSVASGDPAVAILLRDALRPIFTDAMDHAYRRGKALASLMDSHTNASTLAIIVDLPGPEAVAFAAGAALACEPVFAFDNWPHPRGVVPAHLTLAAALYYQPLFARMTLQRTASAPPMFVLDRNRLSPYADENTQFDNRHLARLPTSQNFASMGIKHVLYVTPLDSDPLEQDDVNDDFVHYKLQGITVKLLGATAFGPDSSASPIPPPSAHPNASHVDAGAAAEDGPLYYYGSSAQSHEALWRDYPDFVERKTAFIEPKHPNNVSSLGRNYVPVARATAFSTGIGTGAIVKLHPTNFGMVPIIVAAGTGLVLGAALSRSGSWNRSSGGWGG